MVNTWMMLSEAVSVRGAFGQSFLGQWTVTPPGAGNRYKLHA